MIRLNGELTVTIDGTELNQYGKVRDVSRPLMGSVDFQQTVMPGMDGALSSKPRRGPLTYIIEMIVEGKDDVEVRDKLNAIRKLVKPKKGVEMVVSDEPKKTVHAKLTGDTEYETEVNTKSFTLTFTVDKGYGVGDALSQTVTSGTTIYYDATAETEPIIIVNFTGETAGFKVTHTGPDGEQRQIEVDNVFISGDELIIDCYKKYVTLNGANAMHSLFPMSRWFKMDSGSNEFTYEAFDGTEITGSVTINYEEHWF